MRFESATAHAFGRLERETLEFTPGLNIIYGRNEAGKSTWHDALFAGLCGMRRSRGSRRKEDREFAERRKPWSADDWSVSVRIVLEDGRRIDLRQDLDDLVDCRATDADIGRDVSDEIMNEGSPDGSRWLGLDRRSFPPTACVRQADLLGVLENAELLQDHLQRAAASAGRDETAARALERLSEYRRVHVGLDRANSTRPLRRALDRRRAAEDAFDAAVRAHSEFLVLCEREQEASRAAAELDARLGELRAELARREADAWLDRARRARAIADRFPEGPPPFEDDEALARQVTSALSAWRQRLQLLELTGATSEELRSELESLPKLPEGDRSPAPAVTGALSEYEDRRRSVELHAGTRPRMPEAPTVSEAEPEELRDLARVLGEPAPAPLDAGASSRAAALRETVEALRQRGGRPTLRVIAFALLALGAVAAIALGELRLVGVALGLAGGSLLVWSMQLRSRYLAALEELRELESSLGEADLVARQHASRRAEAEQRARALGAPAHPAELVRLADAIRAWSESRARLDEWSERNEELRTALSTAEDRLSAALRGRGVALEDGADLRVAFDRYRSQCVERDRLATQAARRGDLERELRTREQAERSAAEAERRVRAIEAQLREAAARTGVSGDGRDSLIRELEAWQQRRAETREAREAALTEYARLEELLQGQSLEEVEAEAARRAEAARQEPIAGDEARGLEVSRLRAEVERLEHSSRQARERANQLSGQVQERSGSVPSVSEREEEFEVACAELERVRRLDRILERTEFHLTQAQERVHRDIAPRLAATLGPWLPRITDGRYDEATVDPQTLEVKVRERHGAWRPATGLSHGTAEQVYLLLRFALATHLTRPPETCPLLLDDVTTQCDAERTVGVCGLLHELAQERQIIFFTQEEEVLGWAERELDSAHDQLSRLQLSV
ncbi:MAG: AAA family ATPase [Myxococcota bacterium]